MTHEHVPVLAAEILDLTDPRPGETVIDCTFGGGGHARLLAERIGDRGSLVAIDRDAAAAVRFDALERELGGEIDARFIDGAFTDALAMLVAEGARADIVLLDLGVSSFQIDEFERGFSYMHDAALDMRMSADQELTAADVINGWDERRLSNIFSSYGDERYARRIAGEIVRRRTDAPIESTQQLVDAILAAIPVPARFAGGHPAKRVFQAVRIAVNDELGQLERALPLAWRVLRVGGRLAVISFHSLEDRITKSFLTDLARGCVCPPEFPVCVCGRTPQAELINRRAVMPGESEIESNPRARSSKLRIALKLTDDGLPAIDEGLL